MTTERLLELAQEAVRLFPGCELKRGEVTGNLLILCNGEYVGYIDVLWPGEVVDER